MSDRDLRFKFRTPTKCQNGHFCYFYWEVNFGEIQDQTWGEKSCDCPTHELDEGFYKCGEDQQSTGCQDTNGKLIFEGDIIEFKQEQGRIFWDNGSFKFVQTKALSTLLAGYSIKASVIGNLSYSEVIGNFYENPELLQKP